MNFKFETGKPSTRHGLQLSQLLSIELPNVGMVADSVLALEMVAFSSA